MLRFHVPGFLLFLSLLGVESVEARTITRSSGIVACSSPTYIVADYTALRSKAAQAGQSAEVTGSRIAGCFSWSSGDPYGNGDDGGIVIASSQGGYWIRQWAYAPSKPIELDWFQLFDGYDITSLVDNLAASFSPNLYVRVPTTRMTLRQSSSWDFSCAGHALERFRLLESGSSVTIRSSQDSMMEIGDKFGGCSMPTVHEVIVGSPVNKGDRDSYNLTLDGGSTGPVRGQNRGFVRISTGGSSAQSNVHVRAHFRDVRIKGLVVLGNFNIDTLYLAGTHVNAAIHVDGAEVLMLEDTLYFSDPYGRYPGWTGTGGNVDYKTYGHHDMKVHLNRSNHMYGALETQYSINTWFSAGVEYWGTQEEPFTFIKSDLGFLPDGTPLEFPGIGLQWGKTDPGAAIGSNPAPGRRFLKFIDNGTEFEGAIIGARISFEATDEVCSGKLWHNTYMDVTFVNVNERVFTGTNYYCDGNAPGRSSHNTFRSNGVDPAMSSEKVVHRASHSVYDGGQWNTIEIRRDKYFKSTDDVYEPCNDNSLRNVKLTGKLSVDSGCHGTTLSNVEWIRGARNVLEIGGGTSVTASNIRAPSGSTVEGSGTLILNGKQIALPYTFDGSEGTESSTSNRPPVAYDQSISLEKDQTKTITLEGSDPDSDPLSYSIASAPVHGTITGTAPNLTYSPRADFLGTDSFTFSAHDGEQVSNTATISISVYPASSSDKRIVEQRIDLARGWNNVSLYVRPDDTDVLKILADASPNVVLVKDEEGKRYYPKEGLNELENWKLEEAYYIYVNDRTSFDVTGEPISAETPISLEAGWNYVPYLLDSESPIEQALTSIIPDLVLAKDQEGNSFFPDLGISQFSTMVPGQGYQVYVERPTILVYPENQPLTHWSFEETGDTVSDVSGVNDGLLHGATRTSSGRIGKALTLDGVDDYVDFGTMDIPGSAMTISAWFNADDFENIWGRIVSKATGTNFADHWWMLSTVEVNSSIQIRFRLKTEGTTTEVIGQEPISAREWVHVAARYDGSRMALYVNGTLTGSVEKSGSISTDSTVPVFVGKNPVGGGPYFFRGRIDELMIYDRALTEEEIRAIVEAPTVGA